MDKIVVGTQSVVRVESEARLLDWTVGDLLAKAVLVVPDAIALLTPATTDISTVRSWTYRQLQAESRALARLLLREFKPGDRVATWARASADIVLLQLGAALAGVALVTLNPAIRGAELKYSLQHSGASGLFLDRVYRKLDNSAIIDGLLPDLPNLKRLVYMDEWDAFAPREPIGAESVVAHDSPALILFTSGTTGKPKGVVLSHRGIVNNAILSTRRLALDPGEVWLNVLPMFHVGGSVTMTLGCISNLGTQVLLPDFSADAMLDTLSGHRVTVTMAVPTMLHAMLDSPKLSTTDLTALKVIVTGGTAIAPELARTTKARFGAEVMVLFGQTEAGGAMCLTRRGDDEERITQSVGLPLPLSEAKIISTGDGHVMPIGEAGEICVRTRCAMLGYLGMPEQSRETLDSEGWVHTGDLGVMRPDGYLQVTGRLKDMIIRGGENIYPREIEDALAEHPDVVQAAVFGVPDDKWGEQVAVAVILRPGRPVHADDLTAFLQARLSKHKVPKMWRFVESFPVNASGKIQKFELRRQFAGAAPDISP
jgi:fatty-acyl-CoA synthase